MESQSKNILLVMGMHRSGTSAMARLLNLMGAHIGEDLISANKEINGDGFWEYQSVVAYNESVLADLGRSWYDTQSNSTEAWWCAPSWQEKKIELKSLLQSLVSEEHSQYVIKDPRLCLTYPMWDEVISELGWQHHCFLMVRDPREVALSLLKREGFSIDTSYLLWKKYFESAVKFLNYAPHLIFPYNALISNPLLTAELIATHLPELNTQAFESNKSTIELEVSTRLKHHTAMDMTHSELESKLVEIYEFSVTQPSLCANTNRELALRLRYIDTLLDPSFYQNFNSKLIQNALNARKVLIETGDELAYARTIIEERDKQLAHYEFKENEIELLNERLYSIQSNIKIIIIVDYFASLFRKFIYSSDRITDDPGYSIKNK